MPQLPCAGVSYHQAQQAQLLAVLLTYVSLRVADVKYAPWGLPTTVWLGLSRGCSGDHAG